MALEGTTLPPIQSPLHHHVGGAEITPAEAGLDYEPALVYGQKLEPLATSPSTDEKKIDPLDDEKVVDVAHTVAIQDLDLVDYVPGDPFPVDPLLPEESIRDQMTFRAIFVGCCIGALVQASNMYLGLKTGFTFGPQLLGGIGGYLVLRPLSRVIPQSFPKWFGVGSFGPKENVACQTAATAAGGLGILFVSGFPAMYQLGLLSALPQDDLGKLFAFMFCTAFYGMSFAIPFRKFYILKQRLTFPTPSATAFAIRALHNTKTGAAEAAAKAKWLGFSFLAAFIQKIVSTWAPGILYDWHAGYWLADWGARSAIAIDNWGWYFEITPAFFGAGMLAGINPSWSFYGGSILAWGIIGPSMVATGRAIGAPLEDPTGQGIPYVNYYSMKPKDPTSVNTSPRYNLLWIGVLIMLVASFVEIACQWKAFKRGSIPIIYGIRNQFRRRSGKPLLTHETMIASDDPAQPHEQVPWWMWGSGLIVATVLSISIMSTIFNIEVGITILAIFLGFLFSAMGVLGAGTTDINPVSSCAKASQLIIGGATRGWYAGQNDPTTGLNKPLLSTNLLSGLLSAGAASQTGDMTGDLKTGHLLRAAPIVQYVAQACGAFCSIFLAVGFFVLFTTAAPCIIDLNADTCEYGVPSVAAWRSVAIAVTTTNGLPIPVTSGILAIVLSVVGALMIIGRETIVPRKYRGLVPNPAAAGLAFVLPQTQFGAAMFIGSSLAWLWRRKNISHWERVGYACAAGLVAGEGLGGVIQAILIIGNANSGASCVALPAGGVNAC